MAGLFVICSIIGLGLPIHVFGIPSEIYAGSYETEVPGQADASQLKNYLTEKFRNGREINFDVEKQLQDSAHCFVTPISNGGISKIISIDERYFQDKERYETITVYEKVAINSIESNYSQSFVSCNDGYSLQGKGEIHAPVVCKAGRWRPDPVCLKTAWCSLDDLSYSGLAMPTKVLYRNGESFEPSCLKGYTVSLPHSSALHCIAGQWTGHLPPCSPESCLSLPPSLPHGKAKSYSVHHGSTVNYECNRYFIHRQDSKVTCLFGEWKGHPPTCFDSRCYAKDLYHKKGVASEDGSATYSGHQMDVKCIDGYHVGQKPVCMNGQWTNPLVFPCISGPCVVPTIMNGRITEKRHFYPDYIWYKRRQVITSYEKVRIGTVPHHTDLYISCDDKYSVPGYGERHVHIVCEDGIWRPQLVCQKK